MSTHRLFHEHGNISSPRITRLRENIETFRLETGQTQRFPFRVNDEAVCCHNLSGFAWFSSPLRGGAGGAFIRPCSESSKATSVVAIDELVWELGQTCEAARNGTKINRLPQNDFLVSEKECEFRYCI